MSGCEEVTSQRGQEHGITDSVGIDYPANTSEVLKDLTW
jgi:hypothetical protein